MGQLEVNSSRSIYQVEQKSREWKLLPVSLLTRGNTIHHLQPSPNDTHLWGIEKGAAKLGPPALTV